MTDAERAAIERRQIQELRRLLSARIAGESCVYHNPDQCELFPYTACTVCRARWIIFETRYVEASVTR